MRKVSERFWAVSETPRASRSGEDVRNVNAQISLALGSSAHCTWRTFLTGWWLGREWQISTLPQFDVKHAPSMFIIPHLIRHVILMLFTGWTDVGRACLSSVSLSGWLFRLEASQPGLHPDRHRHTHTNMRTVLSGRLMWCPWAPSSSVGEVEQQGGTGAMWAGRAQRWSKWSSFTGAKCSVVKWDQAAYLTRASSHSSSPSVPHFHT